MPNRVADPLRRLATTVLPLPLAAGMLLACFCLSAAVVSVDEIPAPTGYVSDLANVVNPAEKTQLEELSREVETQLGVQFAFLTVNDIGDRSIRDFGLDVGRKWGVGSKTTNQGILTILVIQQRQNDIEVGRGLEPYVTDGFAGSVRRAMQPYLRQGQYGAALIAEAQALAQHIAEGKGISFTFQGAPLPRPRTERASRDGGIPGTLIILGIFLLFWIIGRGGRRGGGGRGQGGGLGNFATGMLVGDLLNRGRGGGNWDGGGGFGGGSDGGGGFGGFGGGDFGGGGASGNW